MKFLKVLFVLSVLGLSQAAMAGDGSWNNVTVQHIYIYPPYEGAGTQGWVKVQVSANSSGGPTCANGNYNYVAIDLSAAGGGAMFALFASALGSSTTFSFSGTGACSFFSNIETIQYLEQ